VQSSSIGLVSLNWKLRQEGLFGKVELAFMGSQDQPASLMRGDVAAICPFEPYAALAEQNGWGKRLWVPYESPMGKTNLGVVASTGFVKANSDLVRTIVAAHVKATQAITADPTVVVDATINTFNVTREVAERSTRNLFFTTDSGAPFVSGLKALSKMMIDDKLLEKEPDWVSFLNLGYV
jgi:NitT/TauT family transport system substrate-binding protein